MSHRIDDHQSDGSKIYLDIPEEPRMSVEAGKLELQMQSIFQGFLFSREYPDGSKEEVSADPASAYAIYLKLKEHYGSDPTVVD